MSIDFSLRLDSHWVTRRALIDCGSEVNFIHPRVFQNLDVSRLDQHVGVSGMFGGMHQPLGSCDLLSKAIDDLLYERRGLHRFVVADIGELDVILGFPWLRDEDPTISWAKGV